MNNKNPGGFEVYVPGRPFESAQARFNEALSKFALAIADDNLAECLQQARQLYAAARRCVYVLTKYERDGVAYWMEQTNKWHKLGLRLRRIMDAQQLKTPVTSTPSTASDPTYTALAVLESTYTAPTVYKARQVIEGIEILG